MKLYSFVMQFVSESPQNQPSLAVGEDADEDADEEI